MSEQLKDIEMPWYMWQLALRHRAEWGKRTDADSAGSVKLMNDVADFMLTFKLPKPDEAVQVEQINKQLLEALKATMDVITGCPDSRRASAIYAGSTAIAAAEAVPQSAVSDALDSEAIAKRIERFASVFAMKNAKEVSPVRIHWGSGNEALFNSEFHEELLFLADEIRSKGTIVITEDISKVSADYAQGIEDAARAIENFGQHVTPRHCAFSIRATLEAMQGDQQ